MRKLLFLMMSVLLLAACGTSDKNQGSQTTEETTDNATNENEVVVDFVEYPTVSKEIGNNYEVVVESDSEDERVLVFEKDGEQLYKSDYQIKSNLLKIYDLKEDRLIFNKFFKGEQ